MKISVVGLGKLGSPLAAVLASKGHEVIGVDVNVEYVEKINHGIPPVEETGLEELMIQGRSHLRATLNYDEAILNTDVTFIIVPTPSGPDHFFSNRYLIQSLEKIGNSLTRKSGYHLVVITSTVMPGSTAGALTQVLQNASQRQVGDQLGLCYNPEFIALGSVIKNMLYTDMILIGESDRKAGNLLESIQLSICNNQPSVRRMGLVNAEIAKLAVNTFVTTKISYANMLSDICDYLPGADVDIITNAIGLDSRIGSKYLKGGVAFGGPCFPRDNLALCALAQSLGAHADIAEATQKINAYQYERLQGVLEAYATSTKVGILGLSYKPGTNVIEESQGIRMANQLISAGYQVSVYDPEALVTAKPHLDSSVQVMPSILECLEQSDSIIVMTPWPQFAQVITPELLQRVGFKVVIDCWRLLDSSIKEYCDLIYLGNAVMLKAQCATS